MKIALAICTCNRPEWLDSLLQAVFSSHAIDDGVELAVIIVDNYLEGNARPVVENLLSSGRQIHYVHEQNPGIPIARNAAIDHAILLGCKALIFIDDDETVGPHWLATLVAYYLRRQPEVSVVQGPVQPVFEKHLPAWMPEDLFGKLRDHETGEKISIASTNNVIFNLSLCTDEGLRFDENMRHCGGSDTEFFTRVIQRKHVIEWCEEALLEEFIPRKRMRLSWVIKRFYRNGTVNAYLLLKHHADKDPKLLARKRQKMHKRQATQHLREFNRQSPVYILRHLAEALGIFSGMHGMMYNEYASRHV